MTRPMKDILLVLGNSFVEGVGATDTRGWASHLGNHLPHYRVITGGVGGNTSADLLSRIGEFSHSAPAVFVIQIGLNDSRWRPSGGRCEVSIDDFRANMTRLLTYISSPAPEQYVLGLTRVDETLTTPFKPDKHYVNRLIEQYDGLLREVATAHAAIYVPLPPLTQAPGLLADGLHPSDAGHRMILRSFLEML